MYEEALQLVKAYDFLDVIADYDRLEGYRYVWRYGEKAREQIIDGEGRKGIAISGAYNGCIIAEKQYLFKNLEVYRTSSCESDGKKLCRDVLFTVLSKSEYEEKYSDYRRQIFGNKTQGYDHHVYLLAIALLFEDRLGKAFTVFGDINRGQIRRAVTWANEHLERPISMPCRANNEALLGRLSAFIPRRNLLSAFMNITYSPKDEELDAFIRSNFSEEEILEYWVEALESCGAGTLGAGDLFKRYFKMSGDLKMLARACITKFSFKEFADQLVSSQVFNQEKNTSDPAGLNTSDADNPFSDTIETVFGKLLSIGLRNAATDRHIPLEDGVTALKEIYGNKSGDMDIEGTFFAAGRTV